MSESQGGAGRREVAYRLFASEFDDSDFSYSESDEERAPNYVVTPTGARVNRLFVVGVLTEIETVSEDYLRARVVDPTGPFVIYAGQYQPDALAFLERVDPPTFVAVTGKARTYQPDDSDRVFTSIRPESMSEVEAATRDRWVVQTAERTLERVARMAEAKLSGLAGDELRTALEAHGVDDGLAAGIPLALDHYGTTGAYLTAVREQALDTARVVAGDVDEAESIALEPADGGDDPLAELAERSIDVDAVSTSGGPESEDERPSVGSAETGEADEIPAGADDSSESVVGTAEATGREEVTDGPADSDSPDGSTDAGPAETVEETSDEKADEPVEETIDAESGTGESDSATADPETPSTDEDDDLEDFEPEFDLGDDEREEIEEEFGTEFQSGTEVDEPGSADIDVPDAGAEVEDADSTPQELEDQSDATTESVPVEETDPQSESAETNEPEAAGDTGEASEPDTVEEPDEDDDVAEAEPDEDVDLEDAVMDAMTDLDDGDGANREDVLAAVVDRTGSDPDAVDDAIQDALMGGRCYEPDDATLKPI